MPVTEAASRAWPAPTSPPESLATFGGQNKDSVEAFAFTLSNEIPPPVPLGRHPEPGFSVATFQPHQVRSSKERSQQRPVGR